MTRKFTTTDFIEKATKIHNNLYDYSKVNYNGSQVKVCIIDPVYGKFWQIPADHLFGHGHPGRGKKSRSSKICMSEIEFIERARYIHDNLYDYAKVRYIDYKTEICIIDPIYGEFWQIARYHLAGNGCPERSSNGKESVHKDHIIPKSIVGPDNKERPLYKFLNSSINIRSISGKENNKKSDWVEYEGRQIRARDVRNNYKIIAYLSKELLAVDLTEIIKEDQQFLTS